MSSRVLSLCNLKFFFFVFSFEFELSQLSLKECLICEQWKWSKQIRILMTSAKHFFSYFCEFSVIIFLNFILSKKTIFLQRSLSVFWNNGGRELFSLFLLGIINHWHYNILFCSFLFGIQFSIINSEFLNW